MFDLNGKNALVTGASGGIGGAIAKALHDAGAIVALSGTRVEPLETLAASLGERAHVLPCNLSDADAVTALPKQAADAMGSVDILVNNAGITRDNIFMRPAAFALAICVSTGAQAQSASQDCLIIDGLDVMHGIQMRLSRNPDTILFADDIRVLRASIGTISDRAALQAIQSNALAVKGNTFLRFLQNTRALLQTVSMDEPNSVTQHFGRQERANLGKVANYLVDLRCTPDDIAQAEDAVLAAVGEIGGDDDAGQIIRAAAEELISLNNILWFVGMTVTAIVGTRLWQSLAARQRRRAKRHPTSYTADFQVNNHTRVGALIDINCFGTKLRHGCDDPLAKGAQIAISVEDEWIKGSVVWSNAHYAGVQFNRAISLGTVGQVRNTVPKTPQTQNGALGGAASQN